MNGERHANTHLGRANPDNSRRHRFELREDVFLAMLLAAFALFDGEERFAWRSAALTFMAMFIVFRLLTMLKRWWARRKQSTNFVDASRKAP